MLCQGDFSDSNFYDIHKSWFLEYADSLVFLDLSQNNLQNVPKEVLNLPSIREINLSANDLITLPDIEDVDASRLDNYQRPVVKDFLITFCVVTVNVL